MDNWKGIRKDSEEGKKRKVGTGRPIETRPQKRKKIGKR